MLSENLRRLRTEMRMTQEQLSEELGVSPQTISKWERGSAMPEVSMLIKLSSVLKSSPNELLGYEVIEASELSKSIARQLESCPRGERLTLLDRLIKQSLGRGFEANDEGLLRLEAEDGLAISLMGYEPELFMLLLRPENGFGSVLRADEEYRRFFEILSEREVLDAVFVLFGLNDGFTFDDEYAAELFGRDFKRIFARLEALRLITSTASRINSKTVRLWQIHARSEFIALFVLLNAMIFKDFRLERTESARKTAYLI